MSTLDAIAEVERLITVLKRWTEVIDQPPPMRRFYRNELPNNARAYGLDLRELIDAAQQAHKLRFPEISPSVNPSVLVGRLLEMLTPCDDDLATVDDDLRDVCSMLEYGTIPELWARLSGGPVQSEFEADDTAYVNASVLFQEHFTSYPECRKFLDGQTQIRHKQKGQRRLIHAGDWARYWAARNHEAFAACDSVEPDSITDVDVQAFVESAKKRQKDVRGKRKK